MVWLAPLWFAGLAALAMPLFIHLRRQRTGRRIQVGSIRHLSGAALPRRRRLRIRDPWLLALRCAILTALVVALAGPALTRRPRPHHWALLAPELAGSARAAAIVDSLRRAGVEIRMLAPGFPAAAGTAGRGEAAEPLDLWSLLAAADAELPAGSSIVAVVSPRLSLLQGSRPRLASKVTVRALPRDARDTTAVEAAWRRGDSVSRLTARLEHGGTARSIATEPAQPADTTAWAVDSLTVRIVADSARQEDARFVRAAVGAAAATLGVPLVVKTMDGRDTNAADAGRGAWSVWLGLAPPASTGAALLDARGGGRRVDEVSLSDPRRDAYGRPLLTRSGSGELRTFAGRFSPAQGDFVLSAEFPQMVGRLWAAAALGLPLSLARDPRAVAPGQLAPRYGGTSRGTVRPYPLRNLLLALCALLFIWERWLAYRRP